MTDCVSETPLPIYVFDADGVIFADTTAVIAKVFADSLHSYGVPYDEAINYMYETTGQPIKEQYRGILKRYGLIRKDAEAPHDVILQLTNRFLSQAYKEMPNLCHDVLPVLELLRSHRMIVSTNMPQDVLEQRVKAHGIDRFFVGWYGRGIQGILDKRYHKSLVIHQLGITEEEFRRLAALVGDGVTDMGIAKEWGIPGIGRYTGAISADALKEAGAVAVIYSLHELLDLEKWLFRS
jgi:phosphoglycolate phosphatase-like HAD superfamily hydrolase